MNLREIMMLKAASGGSAPVEETVTGNPAVFSTNRTKPLAGLIADIVYTQSGSGDPTPSNIRSISGLSELSAYHSGTNIWDEEWEQGIINGQGQNAPNTENIRSKNYIPVKPGAKYYIYYQKRGTGTNMKVFYYDINKTYLSNAWQTSNVQTIPSGVYYIRFYMDSTSHGTYDNEISINYPYTDDTYHPYIGNNYLVTFPDQTTVFGGSFDFATGLLTITHGFMNAEWSDGLNSNVNLFNKDNVTHGYYFEQAGSSIGEKTASGNANISYVEIDGSGDYSWIYAKATYGAYNGVKVLLFNENKEYISVINGTADAQNDKICHFTVLETHINNGAKYFGYTVRDNDIETAMIVKSSDYPSEYIPYTNFERKMFELGFTSKAASSTAFGACNVAKWIYEYSQDSNHFYIDNGNAYVFLPLDQSSDTSIQIVAELAEPITVQLDPVTINTFKGANVIYVNNNNTLTTKYLN